MYLKEKNRGRQMEKEKSKNNKYYSHITSEHNNFELNLREVWLYRDLIVLFTQRNFKLTYKQTVLGPIWIFLKPFLTSIIYTFVFGGIAGMSTDGIPQILFYLCSNAIWLFFSNCITLNANTFTANANIFGKVYFPRLTVPISNVLASIIQFIVQMILVGIFLIYYVICEKVMPHWWAWILIPIILIHLGVMGLGFGIIISSLTTKYRDLAILVTFGVQLWMYVTPIVYPLSMAGDGSFKVLLMLNPATMPIELFRYAVLGQGTVVPVFYCVSCFITVIVSLFGVVIFNRVEKTFMDTV